MHIRRSLREEATSALVAALGNHNVFSGRWAPLSADDLPAAIVVTPSEEASPSSVSRVGSVVRDISLKVIIVRQDDGSDELDDLLDDDAAIVESILTSARIAGVELHYRASELDHSSNGDNPIGRLALTFQGTAHTKRGNPSTAL